MTATDVVKKEEVTLNGNGGEEEGGVIKTNGTTTATKSNGKTVFLLFSAVGLFRVVCHFFVEMGIKKKGNKFDRSMKIPLHTK